MGVSPNEGSCRFPLIVLQQTTQSFLATHNSVIPAHSSIRQGEQQSVLLALVIALLVVMGYILLQGSAQRPLPEQDELRQAFLFHRSHPAFRVGVQIRTPSWQGHGFYPSSLDQLTERHAELSVPIMQQISAVRQKSPLLHGHVAPICSIHCWSGWGVIPARRTLRLSNWIKNNT